MGIEQRETLNAAVTKLLTALRAERGNDRRTVFAGVVRDYAVLTAELHDIAKATHQHLGQASLWQHPLYNWTVIYQPDGMSFIATSPAIKS